jgi:hypothetical protein
LCSRSLLFQNYQQAPDITTLARIDPRRFRQIMVTRRSALDQLTAFRVKPAGKLLRPNWAYRHLRQIGVERVIPKLTVRFKGIGTPAYVA